MSRTSPTGNGAVDIARLAEQYRFPHYVKTASMEDLISPPPHLPRLVFADPAGRRYPCDTKAAAWLSSVRFQDDRTNLQSKEAVAIEQNLAAFASYWDIVADVEQAFARREVEKQAAVGELPDDAYAYVWTDEDGTKERRLRLTNPLEVKAAADWLKKNRDQMPFAVRNVIANRVLEKAAEFGANVGDNLEFLEQQAGRGVCDPKEVIAMLRLRAGMAKAAAVPDTRKAIEELTNAVIESPRRALHPLTLVKLATTIDILDQGLGLTPASYNGRLKRPEEVLFSVGITKAAAAMKEHVSTTSGNTYSFEQLSKLALDNIRELFGDEFVREVSNGLGVCPEKLATQIRTLPLPDAELFDGMMHEAGHPPVMRKAASARRGFTRANWAAWASQYRPIG